MSNVFDEVKSWVINWFTNNADVRKQEIETGLASNYLENGWIDSFKFIKFIADIEEHFGITFSNDEFQNRNFATIDGLVRIIISRMDEKKN